MDLGVQRYNEKLERLEHPWKNKISKIIQHGCLSRVNNDEWKCGPIRGYNTRTYDLKRKDTGGFRCNCQGYNKRDDCSHTQALYLLIGQQDQGTLF